MSAVRRGRRGVGLRIDVADHHHFRAVDPFYVAVMSLPDLARTG